MVEALLIGWNSPTNLYLQNDNANLIPLSYQPGITTVKLVIEHGRDDMEKVLIQVRKAVELASWTWRPGLKALEQH